MLIKALQISWSYNIHKNDSWQIKYVFSSITTSLLDFNILNLHIIKKLNITLEFLPINNKKGKEEGSKEEGRGCSGRKEQVRDCARG